MRAILFSRNDVINRKFTTDIEDKFDYSEIDRFFRLLGRYDAMDIDSSERSESASESIGHEDGENMADDQTNPTVVSGENVDNVADVENIPDTEISHSVDDDEDVANIEDMESMSIDEMTHNDQGEVIMEEAVDGCADVKGIIEEMIATILDERAHYGQDISVPVKQVEEIVECIVIDEKKDGDYGSNSNQNFIMIDSGDEETTPESEADYSAFDESKKSKLLGLADSAVHSVKAILNIRGDPNKVISKISDIQILKKDLWRLRPTGLLNDSLVNGYLKLLQIEACDSIAIFNSYVYLQLENGNENSARKEISDCLEEKSRRSKLKREISKILVPIHQSGRYA